MKGFTTTLHIELPIALESALLARAAAEGMDISTFISQAIVQRLAASDDETAPTSVPAVRSAQGFAERLQAWADLHPRLDRLADDTRESIYAGRGE